MSDDDAKTLAELKDLATFMFTLGADGVRVCNKAVALIKHQVAELKVARLKIALKDAEIERLSPRNMEPKEACEIMSRYSFMCEKQWRDTGFLAAGAGVELTYYTAIAVAQRLERMAHAGPIAAPLEPEAGEGGE